MYLAILIVNRLDSVPFGSKFVLNAVLFFRTKENNLPFLALEWGITVLELILQFIKALENIKIYLVVSYWKDNSISIPFCSI